MIKQTRSNLIEAIDRALPKPLFLKKTADFVDKYICSASIIVSFVILYLLISATGTAPIYSDKTILLPTVLLLFRELIFHVLLISIVMLYTRASYILWMFSMSLLLMGQLMILADSPLLIVIGFKSILPIFCIFALPKKSFGRVKLETWEAAVKVLLVANFAMQISQVFLGDGYYAFFKNGLHARNPGMFLYPAGSSLFTLVLLCGYFKVREKVSLFWVTLFTFSIVLCASLTGLIGLIAILILNFRRFTTKRLIILGCILVIGFVYLHFARYAMTGPTYLQETGGGRIQIFEQAFNSAEVSPSMFGQYTNTAAKYKIGTMPDSTYTAFLGNFGLIWAVILSFCFLFFLYRNYKNKSDVHFILLFILCSAGINIPETGVSVLLMIIFRYVSEGMHENNEIFGKSHQQ